MENGRRCGMLAELKASKFDKINDLYQNINTSSAISNLYAAAATISEAGIHTPEEYQKNDAIDQLYSIVEAMMLLSTLTQIITDGISANEKGGEPCVM
jgi:hypothetical protein